MRRSWRVFAITLAGLGVLALAMFLLEFHKNAFVHVTASELRQRIARDLPPGTPFPVVEKWANAAFPQHGFQGAHRLLWARYPDSKSDGIIHTDIYVEFYFDREDRLTNSVVTEQFTGP